MRNEMTKVGVDEKVIETLNSSVEGVFKTSQEDLSNRVKVLSDTLPKNPKLNHELRPVEGGLDYDESLKVIDRLKREIKNLNDVVKSTEKPFKNILTTFKNYISNQKLKSQTLYVGLVEYYETLIEERKVIGGLILKEEERKQAILNQKLEEERIEKERIAREERERAEKKEELEREGLLDKNSSLENRQIAVENEREAVGIRQLQDKMDKQGSVVKGSSSGQTANLKKTFSYQIIPGANHFELCQKHPHLFKLDEVQLKKHLKQMYQLDKTPFDSRKVYCQFIQLGTTVDERITQRRNT